jgi:hypothetical protein
MTHTKDEALKLALEALESERPYLGPMPSKTVKAITALKQALAADVQEPVAWTSKQRTLLAQAWAMLEDYAQDQRSHGNDGFADGAEASAHEIKTMLTPPAQPALVQHVQETDHGDELTIAYMSGVFRGKELAAQPAVPLTDEMRKQMKERCDSMEMRGAFADGWLSAEAAHGITKGQP